MKKIFALLVSFLLIGTAFVSAYAMPSAYDEAEILKSSEFAAVANETASLRNSVTTIVDLNSDGALNTADAIYLLRHIMRPGRYPLPTIEIEEPFKDLEIASIGLDEGNHLIVNYMNGTTGNVGIGNGSLIGGGKDGVGIKNIEINKDGHLVVTLTEGDPLDLGVVKGGKGDKGEKGDTGVGISNIIDMPDGRLKIMMTDGKTYEIGVETGECETGKHKYVVTIVAPTCTEQGYTVSVCSECGKTLVSDMKDVTGHHYYEKHCVFCGAEEPYGVIKPNTSWYDSSKNTFELGTKEELAGLSYLVSNGNKFNGKTIYLKNDIDLSDLEWMPIGTSSTAFEGTFDGRFFKISNLKITEQTSYVGLFGNVTGTIKNFNINTANITVTGEGEKVAIVCGQYNKGLSDVNVTNGYINAPDSKYVGSIVGYMSFLSNYTFENVSFGGSITGKDYVGGLFGQLRADRTEYSSYTLTLSALENSGNVTGGGNYVGGLFGELQYNNSHSSYTAAVNAVDLTNTGAISGKYYVGGLFGRFYSDGQSSVKNAVIKANITAEAHVGAFAGDATDITINTATNEGSTVKATGYQLDGTEKNAYLGGYIGNSMGITISDATNYVTIDYTSEGRFVGGFFGYAGHGSYTNIHNIKPVSSKNDYVGGIYGYGSFISNQTYSNVTNTAAVSGKNRVGGLFGRFGGDWTEYSSYTAILSALENSGNVTGSGDYIGGIAGELYYNNSHSSYTAAVNAIDLTNTGAISGKYYVGGLFGRFYSDGQSSVKNAVIKANITGEARVGAFAGDATDITINTATNEGSTVKATGYQFDETEKNAYLGGYIGNSMGITISDATNYVTIDYTSEGRFVGGFFGYAGHGSYTNIHNIKPVSSKNDYVGGIYGYGSFISNQTYSNVTNTAAVSGKNRVGGLFGRFGGSWTEYSSYTAILSALENSGNVTGSGDYVGGIAGELYYNNSHSSYTAAVNATDLTNTGAVSGKSYVGGLFGKFYTDGSSQGKALSSTGTVTGTGNTDTLFGEKTNFTIN